MFKPTPELMDLFRSCAEVDPYKAYDAQAEFAQALNEPIRQALLSGDILGNIFSAVPIGEGQDSEFELDILPPGSEDQHIAYTIPLHGDIPQRMLEGDYVQVPTYNIGSSADMLLRVVRTGRTDRVARMMRILKNGFVKKTNDDGWHTILAAAVDRNILVYDADAAAGQLTKRLISLMKTTMKRNGGGNTATEDERARLTDCFLSPEGLEDIRNWGVDQVDEVTRREIFQAADGGSALTRIFGVNLHDLTEFGEGQEYQNYFTGTLGGALGPSSDVELVVGLDLSKDDSFVAPTRREVEIFPDPTKHRQQVLSFYGWTEIGFGVLDSRRTMLASF